MDKSRNLSARVDSTTAAAILSAGGICAFATETVYGLGADARNADAVLAIYEAKGRPRFNPLIVHCANSAMAETLVVFDDNARTLAERFWPGPLTLVLPIRPGNGIADIVTAGLDTLAVRVPAHAMARALIAAALCPIAAPSANPSGTLSPTRAQDVVDGFAGRVPVLDGGACISGVESTIIACRDGAVIQLRAGAIANQEIEAALGRKVPRAEKGSPVAAPGMLARHYAPRTQLCLDVDNPEPGEAYLGFGPLPGCNGPTRNLSPSGDLAEAARNLFAMLHELDALGAGSIAVAPIPETGLGEAINDRLRRAAER
ncbi:MAG: threonylcarbamoyl-AMP synthase [Alphaproteobacteria bacterium]|nr:threonylcarbamoyl-AMP synthase [Alphaproteobacteria bacterium]